MPSICRNSEILHIAELLPDDVTRRRTEISELYAWADVNVTNCRGCNEFSKIAIKFNGEDCLIPCPVYSEDCSFGVRHKTMASKRALDSLRDVIPRNIWADIETPKMSFALEYAKGWDMKGFLYLYGNNGVGKSFNAAWIMYNYKLQQFMKNLRFPALWDTKIESIAWLSAYRAVSEKKYIDKCCYIPFLVLDDLGEELVSSSNKSTIGEIINERYNRDLATIITTNLSVAELLGRYNKRVEERINHHAYVVQCLGESLRICPF